MICHPRRFGLQTCYIRLYVWGCIRVSCVKRTLEWSYRSPALIHMFELFHTPSTDSTWNIVVNFMIGNDPTSQLQFYI